MGGVKMENEITEVKETPNYLIALALERQADPNTLAKLMDLQERYEAGKAKKAYVVAMTAFKQEAPAVLKKGDRVDFQTSKGRTTYNYANLGSIVQEITAVLGKHELSASWSTSQNGADVTVTCNITHIAGHRESVTLIGPVDDSGNKNRIQAVGSTVTYLQRYTLLAALGLATGEDDDGRGCLGPDKPHIQEPQKVEVFSLVDDITSKNGVNQNTKKPWTAYTIIVNGQKYGTFDKKFMEIAVVAKDQGSKVKIESKDTKFGKEIVSIEIEEPEVPAPEVNVQ
jgi:hypothetical protein